VVEGRDVPGQRHDGVGESRIVRRDVGQPLDLPYDVVAEPADDAAVEGRQVGQAGRPVAGQERLEGAEGPPILRQPGGEGSGGRPVATLVAAPLQPPDGAGPGDQGQRRVAPDEGVAPPPLAVLHRLEQESLPASDELEEHRDRRLEVGQHLPPHRDHRVGGGQLGELGG
jgi:hypothetical protein